jgi:hypothetical protein
LRTGPNEWDLVPIIHDLTLKDQSPDSNPTNEPGGSSSSSSSSSSSNGSDDRQRRQHYEVSGTNAQLYCLVMDLVAQYEVLRAKRHHITTQGVHMMQWLVRQLPRSKHVDEFLSEQRRLGLPRKA